MAESLKQYVSRIVREKQLTLADIEERAGGEISDSYIASIIKGSTTNLSIRKLKALARGLAVPEIELLSAACAVAWPRADEFYESKFGRLFIKYRSLADGHKQELLTVLVILEREIDRRILCERGKDQRE